MTRQIEKVLILIKDWISKKKVGSISINFFKGGVSSVKLEETIKLPKENQD